MTDRPAHESDRGRFTVLDEQECRELLRTTTIARVAFVGTDGLELLPVNFDLIDDDIYLRTEEGSVLAQLADGVDEVALEIDYHADLVQNGWNVTVHGHTRRDDSHETREALSHSLRRGPWAPGDRDIVIRLTPVKIAGRKVSQR